MINQTIFQINPDTRVSALKQTLQFVEKRRVHMQIKVGNNDDHQGQPARLPVCSKPNDSLENGTELELLSHAMCGRCMETGLSQFLVKRTTGCSPLPARFDILVKNAG